MKNREILFLVISSFIIVLAWIGFNLYHNMKTSTINQNLTVQILPISPNFDKKTISDLKKRERIAPLYEIKTSPTPQSTQGGTLQ